MNISSLKLEEASGIFDLLDINQITNHKTAITNN